MLDIHCAGNGVHVVLCDINILGILNQETVRAVLRLNRISIAQIPTVSPEHFTPPFDLQQHRHCGALRTPALTPTHLLR